MDDTTFHKVRNTFILGFAVHVALLFVSSTGGITSLNKLAQMMQYDNPFVYFICWIPSICYFLCAMSILLKGDGKSMLQFALLLTVAAPILEVFGITLIWALVIGMTALIILAAIGMAQPIIAFLVWLWVPGLITAAFWLIAFLLFTVLSSAVFSF